MVSAASRSPQSQAILAATLAAGAMIAAQVGGKAVRDAFFLSNFDVAQLPPMVVGASILSVLFAVLASRLMPALGPGRMVPAVFSLSAALLLGEWFLAGIRPAAAAVVFYLHLASLGSIAISGFWSLINERFDPRTARRQIGRIGAGGTLGGLIGAVLAERIGSSFGITAVLPALAGLHIVCSVVVLGLRPVRTGMQPSGGARPSGVRDRSALDAPSGAQALRKIPYLRLLAALVLTGTMAATLLDYVFKAQASAVFTTEAGLLRFFAAFYTAVSILTLIIQSSLARTFLERLGLGRTVGILPLTLTLGGISAAALPGIVSIALVRGGESVLRSSLFRSGYEVLFTPLPRRTKRSTKSILDVGFDRLGDAVGGGLVQVSLGLGSALHPFLLATAAALGLIGVFISQRLQQGYVRVLEKNLMARALELNLDEVEDSTTRTAVLRTLSTADFSEAVQRHLADRQAAGTETESQAEARPAAEMRDPLLREIQILRSADPRAVTHFLSDPRNLEPRLAGFIIPLLAWDPVSEHAAQALRGLAGRITGQLVDALLDPEEEFAVRRRIPSVLSSCASPRVVEGILLGLQDRRFEVRFRCGFALTTVAARNPSLKIDQGMILDAVSRELGVGRQVWESQRLLDRMEEKEGREASFVDDYVRYRGNRSLEHVFQLLSLVLEKQPLQLAFRGLGTDDQNLRGTALEYLESVLPPGIRENLWPFLEDTRPRKGPSKPREEVLASLMRSHESIAINLRRIQEKDGQGRTSQARRGDSG